jgi:hypothetical protein
MDIRSFTATVGALLAFNSLSADASVIFYNDSDAFNAVTNTAIIDFENIVADDEISPSADSVVIDDIVFTTDPQLASARIFGKDVGGTDSALFVANNGNNIVIDMSIGASGVTAAGGIFGDYDGPAGQQVKFNIYDSVGIIDTQTVDFGDMRIGGDKTFFGWVAIGGDLITRIELLGDLGENEIRFSALDDFQYGAAVPVPAAIWLFGSGLIGLAAVGRRRQ